LIEAAWPVSGARVRLRRLRAADLAAFQTYRADPALGRWQGWTPMADEAARAFLNHQAAAPFCTAGHWFQLAMADLASDSLIGDIGLHLTADGRCLEIGFTLAAAHQGRGLAAEAVALATQQVFACTSAQRVVAITDTRNEACIRLLQRLGWRALTTLPAVFRGEPCVEHHFVLHRSGRAAVRLRPAEPADALAVAQVLIDTRRELMPYAPSAHSDAEVRDWVAGDLMTHSRVTLAEVGDALAGVLATSLHDNAAWIDQLMVRPEHVGAGAGRRLLDHALATCPRPLRLRTFQPNLHARDFYQHHGFVAVKFTDGDNEEGVPALMFERLA